MRQLFKALLCTTLIATTVFSSCITSMADESAKHMDGTIPIHHVRIRIQDPADAALFETLDRQIQDCLTYGVVLVLAYQAHEFKENLTREQMDSVTLWWKTVSEHYQDYSHLLSFDLMIESSDEVNHQPEMLNRLYEQTVSTIRSTNPTRIIMISPRLLSQQNQ